MWPFRKKPEVLEDDILQQDISGYTPSKRTYVVNCVAFRDCGMRPSAHATSIRLKASSYDDAASLVGAMGEGRTFYRVTAVRVA